MGIFHLTRYRITLESPNYRLYLPSKRVVLPSPSFLFLLPPMASRSRTPPLPDVEPPQPVRPPLDSFVSRKVDLLALDAQAPRTWLRGLTSAYLDLRAFYAKQNAFIDFIVALAANQDQELHHFEGSRRELDQSLDQTLDLEASLLPTPTPLRLEVDEGSSRIAREASGVYHDEVSTSSTSSTSFLMNLSLGANVALLCVKLFVLVLTGSLAMLASVLDSFLDILSGIVLWVTHWAETGAVDKRIYPVGKSRMQPVGILTFATAMATSSLFVVIESVKTLAAQEVNERYAFGGMLQVTTRTYSCAWMMEKRLSVGVPCYRHFRGYTRGQGVSTHCRP